MDVTVIAIIVAAILNVIVFIFYGSDKSKAIKGKWRTPEKTLILLGAVGPWGAIGGMHFFRHKTQKAKFKLNYLFAAIHVVVAVVLVYYFA